MTTLENSYCVPRTVEEWVECVPWMFEDELLHNVVGCSYLAYGDGTIEKEPREGMTEIPVPHFLDLLHDRICPWRVGELGGQRYGNERFYTISLTEHRCVLVHFEERVLVDARQLDKGLHIPNITTFTDLLTLIRMLTPPSNA